MIRIPSRLRCQSPLLNPIYADGVAERDLAPGLQTQALQDHPHAVALHQGIHAGELRAPSIALRRNSRGAYPRSVDVDALETTRRRGFMFMTDIRFLLVPDCLRARVARADRLKCSIQNRA